MTVSEFAVQMYHCDIVKDKVMIFKDGERLYDGRMEFLRYAHEEFPEKMWFAGERIQEVKMIAEDNVRTCGYVPDYFTIITI